MNKFDLLINRFEENIEQETNKVVNWLKEKFKESGAKGAVLGMSGGIDCSVVARLLQLAEIPTILVMMPYGESMKLAGDNKDAMALIEKFNFEYLTVDITNTVNTLIKSMDMCNSTEHPTAHSLIGTVGKLKGNKIPLQQMAMDNIKPRVRMTTLYTIAQSMGYLVVGTGNLSEITMGYFTKWGDGASDINPLANFTKTQVRILGKYLELPERIITKAPSANLWQGQTDEDEMGITYYDLDRYILTKEGSTGVIFKVESTNRKIQHKLNPITTYK